MPKRIKYNSSQLARANPRERQAMKMINKKIETRQARIASEIEKNRYDNSSSMCTVQGGRKRRKRKTRRRKSNKRNKKTRRKRKSRKQSKRKKRR